MPRVKVQRKDSCPINQILPVEILTIIFLLLGPSSIQNPYIYLPLSWVCRRWRSIVLNTSVFWTFIIHQCKRSKLDNLARDVIFRSKPREIDVASYAVCRSILSPSCNKCSSKSCLDYFNNFQIRTLCLHGHREFDFLGGKKLTQVETLILSQVSIKPWDREKESFNSFLSIVNPRFLELSETMLCQYMPVVQILDRVEWLKIDVTPLQFLGPTVSHVLKALPHLRILNLIGLSFSADANLPNLRMLSMNLEASTGLHSIRTPALSYLGVSVGWSDYEWDPLNSVDLPMQKSFRIALCNHRSEYFGPYYVACISTGHSEEDCDFFNGFHAPFSHRSEKSMDSYWSLPPPNSFHISFHWKGRHERLFSHLKRRARNLVEFIVDCRSMPSEEFEDWTEWREGYCTFLGEILNIFDTVIHLTVLCSCDFILTCDLLMDGRRLPRLERFTYHNTGKLICGTKVVLAQMEMAQRARIKAGSEPLKTLELKGFLTIPRAQVLKLEKLGIRLEQYV